MVNIITQSSDSFATYYYITTSDYRYVNFVDFDSQHLVPKKQQNGERCISANARLPLQPKDKSPPVLLDFLLLSYGLSFLIDESE